MNPKKPKNISAKHDKNKNKKKKKTLFSRT